MLRRTLIGCAVALAASLGGASAARATSALFSGQTLASGQALYSDDGHYELAMQADGNLVLSSANPLGTPRTIYSSGTGTNPGAYATLEPTGALVVFNVAGIPVWSNNASASGCTNLDVQTDGNLVAYDAAGVFWSSHTEQEQLLSGDELLPGQFMVGYGGDYELQMGTDGVLRAVDSVGTVWSSGAGPVGSYAVMSTTGELEVITPAGTVAWSTDTAESPGAHGILNAQGEVAIVSTAGHIVYSSGTAATRSGLRSLNYARPFAPCPVSTPAPAPTPGPQPVTQHRPTRRTQRAPVRLKLPGTKTGLEIGWRFRGATSWIHSIKVTHFPRSGRLTISCTGGRGCPTTRVRRHGRRVTVHRRFETDRRHLKPFERSLTGRRFRVGDRLVVVASQPHHRSERNLLLIRDGRKPQALTARTG